MPTYDYKCAACGETIEQFQSIKAAPLKKCPKCGKNKLQRLISGGGAVIFKGSGFYITDYRSDSYKDAAKKESEPKPAGDGPAKKEGEKPSTGAEKSVAEKPATKPESRPAKSEGKSDSKPEKKK